jgi:hypothetical protein
MNQTGGRLLIFALAACVLTAQAQGPIRFYAATSGTNEVPPNSDTTAAYTRFTLDGNMLSFLIFVPVETFISRNAYIQGPAVPETNGPIIFDLGESTFNGGIPEFCIPGSYAFGSPFDGVFGAGPFALTDSQINDLRSGLWYLNVTSYSRSDGQIRGQILEVPSLVLSYANNQAQCEVTGTPGAICIVQTSTSLVDWVSIQTNTLPFILTDAASNHLQRFYRAKVDIPPPWVACFPPD